MAVLAAVFVAVVGVAGADGQVRVGVCQATPLIQNGSFEQPVIPWIGTKPRYKEFRDTEVPGWHTDSPEHKIELWQNGFLGVPAAQGYQFAEIAGGRTTPVSLYQDVATVPGEELFYAFNHRGREGVDTMAMRVGPPGGPANFTRLVTSGNNNWQQVFGDYVVPSGQTETRFAFAWVRAAQGSATGAVGNLLDGVVVSRSTCSLQIRKVLVPASDPGRFDLFAADQRVASAVGDGGSSPVLAMALPIVHVSERSADPVPLDKYVSTTRCVDRANGEVVAEAPASELTLVYDRPMAVRCTIENVRGPALIMEKETYPADDPGRFDLRLDGTTVAAAVQNGYVTDPTPTRPGKHVVSSVPVRGAAASEYGSSVQCRTHGRRAAVEAGRTATIRTGPELLGTCVFIDVRADAPDPLPPEPVPEPGLPLLPPATDLSPITGLPETGTPPTAGLPETGTPPTAEVAEPSGDGELDVAVQARALQPRVNFGQPARFRVLVSNIGPVTATRVRVVLSARQASPRAQSLAVSATAAEPCASAGGLGFCVIDRLAPGAHVAFAVTASTRPMPAPVRLLAVIEASEPERIVANNTARARVLMRPPVFTPCLAATDRPPVAHAAC